MNKRFRILIDIDNTIGDLSTAWLAALNERYSLSVTPRDLTSYNVTKAFPSLSRDEVYSPLRELEFWTTVEPYEGAVDGLKVLNETNDIYLCTASDYKTIERKYEDFIQCHFPFIDWSQIIICEEKSLIKGDIFIDDYPLNLRWNDAVAYKYLFDQPYNRPSVLKPEELTGLFRVFGWNEIVGRIEELKND